MNELMKAARVLATGTALILATLWLAIGVYETAHAPTEPVPAYTTGGAR